MRITDAVGYTEPRDSISHDWLETLATWGMSPVLVPNIGAAAVDYLKDTAIDILVLTGGENIGTNAARDATETALLKYALTTGLPVFGVCRGLQLINTHLGGRLGTVEGHVAAPHGISFVEMWTPFYGTSSQVNSYHNISIPPDGVAAALTATAQDKDGNVEAVMHPDKPLAAVMWHPERVGAPDGDRQLFDTLLEQR
jgi:gamma-glutamyl-gamma-aminobutyrate hydrolase PuuD